MNFKTVDAVLAPTTTTTTRTTNSESCELLAQDIMQEAVRLLSCTYRLSSYYIHSDCNYIRYNYRLYLAAELVAEAERRSGVSYNLRIAQVHVPPDCSDCATMSVALEPDAVKWLAQLNLQYLSLKYKADFYNKRR